MLFLYMEATPASLYRTWHHTYCPSFMHFAHPTVHLPKHMHLCSNSSKQWHMLLMCKKNLDTWGKKRDAWYTSMCLYNVRLVLFRNYQKSLLAFLTFSLNIQV